MSNTQEGLGSKRRRGNVTQVNNPVVKCFNVGLEINYIVRLLECFAPPDCLSIWQEIPTMLTHTYAANNSIPGYLPLGYNSLRTTLLQKERANVERLLEPIKGTWKEKGVTIASDG
ncbi:hypothetical protein RHMOL_Rhmol13G0170600 [Rhododendron molle]|uniref:Uncharacterized protein n=1 Tax=Rhododendron molle TaxID=49168 RepID=A0ACC0L901_RHOML|nr:hypothetical protein RHMOL_Rhmol13G0170600 [Rhododendron molle]